MDLLAKTRIHVLHLIIMLLSFAAVNAQLDSEHFLPPLKRGNNNSNEGLNQQEIYLSTPETTPFSVNVFRGTTAIGSITGLSNGSPQVFTDFFALPDGDNNITLVTDANTGVVLSNAGLRFVAPGGEEFYVNYRGRSGSQVGSLTAKGRTALGTEFRWGGIPNRSTTTNGSLTTSLGILATVDGTVVNVFGYDPACEFRIGNNRGGNTADSFSITLNAGQSYVIEAAVNETPANRDGWLGATITSNQPIAISNGGLNFNIITGRNRDVGIDQPVPINALGREYVFVRGNGGNNTEVPVIVGVSDGTDVFVGGAYFATINDGEYVEIPGSFYSGTGAGNNMYVNTSRDVYAYQCLQGDTGRTQTVGMNFIAPVTCLLPDVLNEISAIDQLAGITLSEAAITIIASTSTPDANITVTDGNGPVTLPASIPATGTTEWKTFFVNGLEGEVQVSSTGPIAVGVFGNDGNNGGFAGYFSGFDNIPDVQLTITGAGCFPGGILQETTGPYDAYQWFKDGVAIPGATLSSFDPSNPGGGIGEYFVRVTRGPCSYDSPILDVFDCSPNIVVTKTDSQDPVEELEDFTFTIQVESLGLNDVTNLVVQDILPPGLTLVSATPSFGTWTAPNWNVGTITSGQIETLQIVARADFGTAGTTIINSVTVTQDQTDSNNTPDDLDEAVTITSGDTDGDGNPNSSDPNPNSPNAVDDSGFSNLATSVTIDILSNDDFLDNLDASNLGTTSISDVGTGTASGTISFDANTGELTYTPIVSEAGSTVTIVYQVCNDSSGSSVCDTATVSIVIEGDNDGDGIGDSADLDNDNDGILDADELGICTTGNINYEFYDLVPSGNTVDNIPNNPAAALSTGQVSSFDVGALQAAVDPGDSNQFSIRFSGFINISFSGSYTFYTSSDDGSKLFIDGTEVVDNDGLHGNQTRSGSITLSPGIHQIEVLFFENSGGETLTVEYQGPSIARQQIPFTVLSSCNLDTDLDGIPDYLDLDSDNDGCADAIEADENVDPSQLLPSGAIDVASTGGIDGQGVPNLVNAGGGADVGGDQGQGLTTAYSTSDVITNFIFGSLPFSAEVCEGETLRIGAIVTGERVTDFGTNGTTADDTTIPIPPGDLIYRWYLGASTVPLTDTPPYSGTSTSSLTITNPTAALDGNTYRVEVTTSNNSCPVEDDITITVNQNPSTPVSTGDVAFCTGDPIPAISVTVNAGETADWYDTPTGGTLLQAASLSYNPPAAGTYYAEAVNTTTNCISGSRVAIVVAENALPSTPAITGDNDLCEGETTALSTTATGTVVWSSSDTGVATVDPSSGLVTAITAGTTDITYAVTDANGCGATSAVLVLTVNALDDASFSYPANTYCTSDAPPFPTVTGLGGGSFSSTPGLSIFPASGAIILASSTPGTYTVTYTTSGPCPNSSNFIVTINDTPLADAPADVEACDTYTLPALTNGNYFTTTGGVGPLSAGDVITSTQTIFVYSAGSGSCPDVENSFVVTINDTPLADAPADVEACDTYTLPALTNGNYFTATGGVGPLSAGDVITSTQTIFVYSAGSGSCPDVENSFVVTINDTPLADAPADVEACDTYTLPALTNGNYFTATGGVGPLSAGDVITSTQTIFVYSAGSGSCPDVENSFVVTINDTPLADAPADVEACDTYTLPALTNGNYFTATGGVGPLSAGDVITSTQTIFVYSAGSGSCPDVENSFVVTINDTPLADAPADVEACDTYTLPALTNGNYFTATGGVGPLSAGDVITSTQTIFVYSAGSGSCPDVENSFVVTINNTPLADAPADVEACDTYTLPALTNGNYFTATGGVGPLSAGDVITSTQTIFVYSAGSGSCPDVENSFVVTINDTPLADAPADVEACDTYTLPALTNGNYFTATGGVGPLSAGDVITSTQTIFVYSAGSGSCPDVENSFVVTINDTPLADAPADVEACDTYTLPALTNGNYFTATGGVGPLSAGDVITSTQTIFVYSAGSGSCPDVENSFVVTINDTPLADAPADVEACDTYTLPALTNGNYFTATGGVGPLSAGDVITSTQTIFVYSAGSGSCPDVENSFVVTINDTPLADAPADVEACDTYTLPALTNGNYFTATGGVGPLSAGDVITSTQTIFVYSAGSGSCPDVENSFVVTINDTPLADAPADVEACDTYTLPALTNGNYFTATGGVGPLSAGDVITSTQTIFVYSAGSGSCPDVENSFVVTINDTPLADAPADVEACDTYTLPALTNGNYFTATGGVGPLSAGDVITSTQTIFVYSAGSGSCPDVENSFVVTINALPSAPVTTDVSYCVGDVAAPITTSVTATGTLTWYSDAAGTIVIAEPTIDTSFASSTTYYVSQTDTNTCESGVSSITVTVNSIPVIATTQTPLTGCDTDDGIITVTGGGSTGVVNWSGPVSGNSGSVSLPYDITGLEPGTYDVTFTDDATGCTSVVAQETFVNPGAPVIDPIADYESCDVPFTLLVSDITGTALTGGQAYYTAPGGPSGGGVLIPDGTVYSAPTNITIYAYDENGACSSEESFTVIVNSASLADAPADVEACDTYTLPALTNGNYFTATGGVGPLSAGDVITSTQTIFVYSAGSGSCPDVENSFVVTINDTPLADAPADVEACDTYTLPALTNGNYFTATGGVGPLSAGDVITSTQTIFVYSAGSGSCPDVENSFVVTINDTPLADAPADVEACDTYTLPALTNGNYFTATGGVGPLSAGDVITSTQTIFVYSAGSGSCPDVENSFVVTINDTPLADAPADVEACDTYTLPALTNGNYFTATGGVGPLSAGDVITSTQTIFVYSAGSGSCPDVENSFVVTINDTPLADAPADVEACDTYTLPALTNGNYFTATGGVGPLSAGDVITSTQTIFVYSAGSGSCPDVENSFVVTINDTPLADAPADVEACDTYTLPALTNGNYFTATGGVGPLSAGDVITSTQTIFVYSAGSGSCPDVENSFVVTINDTPLADAPADVEACDTYTLPALTNGNYFTATGGVGPLSAGDVITSTQTIFVYSAGSGSCPDVENSFVVTINDTPLADAPADVESCDSYVLPALTNGTYYTGLGGTGSVLNAGDSITTTQTIYVFSAGSGSCPDVENSFVVTINALPSAPVTTDVSYCVGDVAAPITSSVTATGTLTWYSDAAGTIVIAEPTIDTSFASSTTYYVSQTDTNTCESGVSSITVTVNSIPVIATTQTPLTGCDTDDGIITVTGGGSTGVVNWSGPVSGNSGSVSLPYDITGLEPGTYDVTFTDDATGCTSVVAQETFVNPGAPVIDPIADYESCDVPFTLLVSDITGTALTGGQAYYTAPGGPSGGGVLIPDGTVYSAPTNITIYAYDENGACSSEESFTVIVNSASLADAPADVEACDTYTLPALTNGNYFTATGGVGPLSAGDVITSTQTIFVYSAGSGSCPDVENSFVVTINDTPLADAPADVEACDTYTLPALTNGNYFTATGGVGPLSAGDVITSTQTIFVYSAGSGSCPDVENSFVVTINDTPLADAPADVEACDTYTLPALTNGNYFTATGGVGPLSAGDVITSTQTIFVYSAGSGSCPDVENSFVVTINDTPLADAPADVEACDTYTLPALTNGNYFTATGGVGPLSAGDVITSTQTIFVYSAGSGSCPDVENSFVVTINDTPLADAPADVEACDTYTLPALTNGNYFTATGGVGPLSAGDVITSTQTIFVYSAGSGSCPDVENSFVVTINDTPLADAPADVEACDTYTLPALTNGNYFTATGGVGPLSAGDVITSTQTIFVYSAGSGSCPDVENSFVVTINDTPLADAPADVEACDTYTLPALTNGNYFTATGGVGPLSAGDVITSTQTIFVYSAGSGSCPDVENSFVVTINDTPLADAPADVESCDSYVLPALTNGTYYTGLGGTGSVLNAGDSITTTQTIYVFSAGSGSCPDVENSFVVTINALPSAPVTTDVSYCVGDVAAPITSSVTATGTLTWYSDAAGTIVIAEPTIDTSVASSTTYFVSQTDTNTCESGVSSITVTVNSIPVIATTQTPLTGCDTDDGIITVTGGGSTGVVNWSGPVSGSSGSVSLPYDITGLEPGTYDVTFTDDATGCTSAVEQESFINPGAPVIDPIADYESCDVPFTLLVSDITGTALTGGQAYYTAPGGPSGGGVLIPDGTVYSAPTNITIYAYDENGACSSEESFTVVVNALPTIVFANPADVCIDAGVQTITGGATPAGGVYSGTGVTDNGDGTSFDFDPALAGVGTTTITYTYTDANGCTNSGTADIEVNDLPVIAFADPADVCIDAGVQTITGGATPAGGVYSGTGVTDNGDGTSFDFDPSIAGVGTTTITYTYTDANGCTNSGTADIEVNDLPVITFTAPADVCIDAGVQTITGGATPAGGVYSGTGVTDNGDGTSFDFDPALAGVGTTTITYTYTDANGCTNSGTADIEVNDLPVIAFADPADVCIDAGVQTITGGATPAGGVYSGTGVTDNGDGTSFDFDPSIAGVGTTTITYTYTDANGCTNSGTADIEVNDLPVITFTAPADVCIDAGVQTITGGATPAGGVYSGTGVTDNGDGTSFDFDPSIAGVGTTTITYTYTDANGCTNPGTADIEVNDLPVITFTAPADVCIDAGVQTITGGATPAGGVYSGTGVTDNGDGTSFDFDPSIAGVGTTTITYTYTDANGCTNSGTADIEVNDLPVIAFADPADVCIDAGVQTITGGATPAGGVYSGTGVTDNGDGTSFDFDPAVAGVGTTTITYTYTDANGCTNSGTADIEVNDLPVITFADPADVCIDAGVQTIIGGATPAGGVYSGTGVTDNGDGTSFDFDPSIAGVGTTTITYTYTDANGCTNSGTADIEVNDLPVIATTQTPLTGCDTDDGIITVTGGGSTGVVNWSGPVSGNSGSVSLPYDITGLEPGTYDVTFTDDATGCTSVVAQETFVNPGAPVIDPIADYESCDVPFTLLVSDITGTALTGGQAYYTAPGGPSGGGVLIPDGTVYSAPTNITIYAYDENGACSSEESFTVVVNALPTIVFANPADVCIDAGVQTITGGATPAGGVYSGTGVTDNGDGTSFDFDPSIAGVGTTTITYTYTDANGCTNSGTADIEVNDLPVIAFADPADVCIDAGVQTITGGATPAGGVYSGTGVTDNGDGTSFDFDPSIVGVGTTTITYTYTDANGCTNSGTADIEVNDLPVITFADPADVCIDAGVQTITGGATPAGGVYSGTGVTDNGDGTSFDFDPSIAGVGTTTITYTYTDANGCTNSGTADIEVNDLPVIAFADPADVCIDAGVQTITGGATPAGGVYSGTGVTDNGDGTSFDFDPSIAGVGTTTITYTYTDANGCTNSGTADIEVNDLPVITFTAPADVCIDAGVQTIAGGATPAGGVYSGTGVTDNGDGTSFDFDPSIAGVGTTTITYTYTDTNGCTNSGTADIEVNDLPVISVSTPATCSADLLTYSVSVDVSAGGIVTSTSGTVTDNGADNWTIDNIASGTDIILTVTGLNGCTVELAVTSPDCSCPTVDAPISAGDAAYCIGDVVPTISATVNAGETINWYDAPTGGALLLASSLNYTPAGAGTYYAEAINTTTSCVSNTRTAIVVTENPLDDPSFSYAALAYCSTDADPSPTITGLAGGTFSSTAGLVIDATTGLIDLDASTPGSYTITYLTNGICPNSSVVNLTIDELPVVDSPSDISQCGSGDFVITQTTTVGTGAWSLVSSTGAAPLLSDAGGVLTVTGLPDGTSAVLRWTATNGECEVIDEVTITNNICSIDVVKTQISGTNPVSAAGEVLGYEIVITNTGTTSVTGIVVTDILPDSSSIVLTLISGDLDADSELDVNETWVYNATYTVTQSDINAGADLVNTASVVSVEVPGPTTDTAITPINDTAELVVTKVVTTGGSAVGDVLSYDIIVTNTGNVTLTDIEIDDPNADAGSIVGSPIAVLAPGASVTVTAEQTITQADVDAGYIENSAIATGDSPSGTDDVVDVSDAGDETVETPNGDGTTDGDPTNDPTVTPIAQNAGMVVTKVVTTGGSAVGDVLSYDIIVTNTGNVTLTDIEIDDPNADAGSIVGSPIAVLAPGASATVTAEQTITQADVDAGYIENSAIATGDSPSGTDDVVDVSDAGDETVETPNGDGTTDGDPTNDPTVTPIAQNAGMVVTKVVTTGGSAVGDVLSYDIIVTNTGNVTLTDIEIDDPNADAGSIVGSPIAVLAPGASATVTAEQTITQADVDAGYIENSAIATGDSPSGTDDVVDVSDAGDETVETPNGDGTTDGDPTNDPTVTPIAQNAGMVVTKVVTTGGSAVGDVLSYDIIVTNTGNVTLTDIEIDDPNADAGSIVGSPIAVLAPGASATVTAEQTITQADVDAGYIENSAIATGDSPSGTDDVVDVSDAGDETVETPNGDGTTDGDPTNDPTVTPIAQNAGMVVTKVVTTGGSAVGDVLSYDIIVTNTGNVTLTDIEIDDPNADAGSIVGSPIAVLAPGASATVTAEQTITQADVDAGYIENSAIATGDSPSGTDDVVDVSDAGDETVETPNGDGTTDGDPTNDPTVITIDELAGMEIVKTANYVDNGDGIDNAGDSVVYTIEVTNTGNVTLNNLILDDVLLNFDGQTLTLDGAGVEYISGTLGSSEGTVQVGEVVTYTATYTIQQDDVNSGGISNSVFGEAATLQGTVITDTSDDGDDEDGNTEDDPTETIFVLNPSISLLKSFLPLEDDNGDGIAGGLDDIIRFVFTVQNTGNTTLFNVNIIDPLPGVTVTGGPIAELDPGEVDDFTITATYQITQDDIDLGIVINLASVSSVDPDGEFVTDFSDDPNNPEDADIDGDGDPDDRTVTEVNSIVDIEVIKTVDITEPVVGDEVVFTIEVANVGNVNLVNVLIDEELPSGYAFVSATTTSGDYSELNGEWLIPEMGVGQVHILQITAEVLGIGNYVNVAFLSSIEDKTDDNPDNDSSEAVVEPICLTVYNEFSPNGDGINETFVIDCIERFPNNRLEVYNRWGNLVFAADSYKNDWGGTSNGRAVVSGSQDLPVGTYYYILDLRDGTEPRNGWLYINR